MKKLIEQKILHFESSQGFNPAWYGVFVNPFYITRSWLYARISDFTKTVGTGKKILDVGCGIKPYAELFKGNSYTGTEVEGGGHAENAKRSDRYFDGRHIPFADEQFDLVISSEVFEHAEDLETLVSETRRVLRHGGVLLVTMPFVWAEHEKPYDFRRFTSFGHRQLLARQGFTVHSIAKTTGAFGTAGQVLSDFLVVGFTSWIERMPSHGLGYKIKFIVKRLFVLLVCAPIQIKFLFLDWIFRHKGLTLDYIVVAQKQ